jgi:hypothetical protein
MVATQTLIVFLPIVTFAFYQWTLKDSWASVLLSVLFLLVILGSIILPSFLTTRLARRKGPDALHAHPKHLIAHGPLHAHYRPERWYAFLPVLGALFLRSLFIAFAAGSAMAQVILLLVTEVFLFVTLCVLKPHPTRGADVFAGYLSLSRIFATGLFIAFVPSLGVKPIPRVVIGIIVALIYSVAVVVSFFNIVLHLGIVSFFRRSQIPRRQPSDLPLVGEKDITPGTASVDTTLSPFAESPVAASPFRDPEVREAQQHYRSSSDPFTRDHRTDVV